MPATLEAVQQNLVKPAPGALLNTEHPLYPALAFAVPLLEGGGNRIYEAKSGAAATLGSAISWVATPFGPGLNLPNSGSSTGQAQFGSLVAPPNAAGSTMVAGFLARSTGAVAFGTLWRGTDSAGQTCGIFFNGSANLAYRSNGVYYPNASTTALNAWHSFSAINAVAADTYIDNAAQQACTASTASSAAGVSLTIGSNASGNTFDGILAYLYVFNRVLSDGERQAIAQQPFSLFTVPSAVRRYWQAGFPASGTTVTGNLGTAALQVSARQQAALAAPATGTTALLSSGSAAPALAVGVQAAAALAARGALPPTLALPGTARVITEETAATRAALALPARLVAASGAQAQSGPALRLAAVVAAAPQTTAQLAATLGTVLTVGLGTARMAALATLRGAAGLAAAGAALPSARAAATPALTLPAALGTAAPQTAATAQPALGLVARAATTVQAAARCAATLGGISVVVVLGGGAASLRATLRGGLRALSGGAVVLLRARHTGSPGFTERYTGTPDIDERDD